MGEPVIVSTDVDAPATTVFALVSDLPRMGEWSPENVGGRWLAGASGPAVGARFRGANRKGFRRWSTTVRVTDAQAPRRFAFDVTLAGMPISSWSYDVGDRDGGCTVTETWVDRRPGWMRVAGGPVMGVPDRAAYNRLGMEQTLAAVKKAAESA
jgi:hypothetical protein